MSQDERIITVLAIAGLVALLISTVRDNLASGSTDYPRNNRNYNVIRWRNVTGIANILPQSSLGENGVPTNDSLWSGGSY